MDYGYCSVDCVAPGDMDYCNHLAHHECLILRFKRTSSRGFILQVLVEVRVVQLLPNPKINYISYLVPRVTSSA